jgi:Tfp pilus assembly protein PilW
MLSDHPTDPAASKRRPALSDEQGYSLIELLVAIIGGLAVCFALFAILNVATDESAHLTGYAQATQQGRNAMTTILDELHSTCIAPGFAPIQAGSGPNELRFINAYGEEAVLSKAQVNEHRILWNKETRTLTDYAYPAVKEVTWPTFEYSSTASPAGGKLIATNVTESESGGKKIPIFQYYSYVAKYNESASAGLSTLNTEPLTTPLTKESNSAPTAASVLISFNTGPSDGKTDIGALGKGVTAGQQSQVTLSFSVPISNNEVVDAPCK